MNTRKNVSRLAWVSLIVAGLLGLGTWCPRHPVLKWYVSAPLDARGRRAKVLVPYNWQFDARSSHLPAGIPGPDERVTIVFVSQESILSRWLRWVRKQPPPPSSRLYLDIGRKLEIFGFDSRSTADGKEDVYAYGFGLFTPNYLSCRIIKVEKPEIYGVAALGGGDKLTFDHTHTCINSFRIE
jgi:hypothetical protein